MKKIILFWLAIFITHAQGSAQEAKCECKTTNVTNLCFFSKSEYCLGVNGCNHTIDGTFMEDYIAAKLLNTNNFGSNAISNCEINLIEISKLKSVKQINDAKCDIFLVGSFNVDTISKATNPEKTSIPTHVLNKVKAWSEECDRNLVIVSQAEAIPWGYKIENKNINPNTASTNVTVLNIFNGAFGSLTQFSQGGTYQGVITQTPATGHTVLARDNSAKPTVAYDTKTKDIILGDIGILCGIAGAVSKGPLVDPKNPNDILAANIFALGCNLSSGKKFTEEEVFLCKGYPKTLPNGKIVTKEGVYRDSLLTAEGCDSIHFYKAFYRQNDSTFYTKNLCKGDTTKIKIGDKTFTEASPSGIAKAQDRFGCDSFVTVSLRYLPHTKAEIKGFYCKESNFNFKVGNDLYDFLHPKGKSILKNTNQCDSIVTVDLTYGVRDTTLLEAIICKEDTYLYNGKEYEPEGIFDILFYTLNNTCDSLVILDIGTYPSEVIRFDTVIQVQQYLPYTFTNKVGQNVKTIKWETTSILSCYDCINPILSPNQYPAALTANIIDNNNCSYRYTIHPQYACGPILPNVIKINNEAINGVIAFKTECPVSDFHIEIFDRWGNKVYETHDINDKWSPNFNASNIAPGVYVYKLRYTSEGSNNYRYGDITVLY